MPVNAEEVLKNVKVPLEGDLLGRERITGAKKTRLGVTVQQRDLKVLLRRLHFGM